MKTGQLKYVKSMIMKIAFLSSLEDEEDFDPKYFNLKLLRELSTLKNNKGYTPILLAIEDGNTEIFQFLLSLLIASDQLSAGAPLLPKVLNLKCDAKGENSFLKASRLNHLPI